VLKLIVVYALHVLKSFNVMAKDVFFLVMYLETVTESIIKSTGNYRSVEYFDKHNFKLLCQNNSNLTKEPSPQYFES
jgi:hypothetical protein